MTRTPMSVENQGLITQDCKVHDSVVKSQQGKENYIASKHRLLEPWTSLVGGPSVPPRAGKASLWSVQHSVATQTDPKTNSHMERAKVS